MITAGERGVYIDIQAQPRARRPGVRGVHGQRLKLAVAEPPDNGKANRAIVDALAELLNVPSKSISLVAGKTSRSKRLFVEGISPGQARKLIDVALESGRNPV